MLGLEGIKYSHIQHADLSKIEIELHEMGLNRAHHALLQGMRTQDILFKRIEACSGPEDPSPQAKNFSQRGGKEWTVGQPQWILSQELTPL